MEHIYIPTYNSYEFYVAARTWKFLSRIFFPSFLFLLRPSLLHLGKVQVVWQKRAIKQ